MSIFSTMYIGMSGMRANEGAIGTIGDNIANSNTIGFKGSRAVFADLLSQTVLGSAGMSQAGQGVSVAGVQRLVTQGALLGTGVSTDLAINGQGYFIVNDASGQQFYSRNGQFQVDNEGYLTTVDNLRLQGYAADDNGVLAARLSGLQINDVQSPPRATTEVNFSINLDSESEAPTSFISPDDPDSYNYTSQMTVYDSLGNAHQVDVYYAKTGDNEWIWSAVVAAEELGGDPADPPIEVGSGPLSFDGDGNLVNHTPEEIALSFPGANSQTIDFNFEGTTQLGAPNSLNSADQDGFGVGTLSFVDVDETGQIHGTFTNGREVLLGQLALARFDAPELLNAVGGNRFTETLSSGQPAIGTAGTGARGTIFAGTLEQSNVDLTNEFTQLIVAQRGFQASSRTVTTADEMMLQVLNLKQ
ncbi:MAG: flagellar hook protein FlgE [Deltaproteobacteria bacterium HGW-Deltaproteobacteria-14]|jgi:flagellar hook protein FlgE|nr:MAG: flagellar hook protein FlgE [Deltaproteobacteria bacterium HGW-Deltaproteobacteria-14]